MAAAQQRDAGTVIGGECLKRFAGDLQMLTKLMDPLRPKQLRHHARHDATVFQRVGQPLRLAGAVRQHPPRTVRPAQHIGSVKQQMTVPPAYINGAARAEVGGIAVDKVRWDQSLRHQRAGAIEIGQDQFHELGALGEASLDRRKLGGRYQQGHRIAAPIDRTLARQDRGYALVGERLIQQPRPLCQRLVAKREH
jgi:hypothetical protein